jgi:uncharacterized protein (TIGR03000 family)
VTNSSYLVKRFFEAGLGKRSLGGLQEYRYARAKMPLDRDDAIFIYLSDPFFRLLTGPQYRVEMTRRMRALGDLQLYEMAQLAAKMEGVAATSPAELVHEGFLPSALLDRCDGSRPMHHGGRPIDSLRGAPGVFLPIPDVPLGKITAGEAQSYRQFVEKYRRQWQRIDPVTVGITRRPDLERKRERVPLDVQITPYAREHYQALFQLLGPPENRWRAPIAGDLMAIDMRVQNLGQLWSAMPFWQGHLFGAVRDFSPGFTIRNGVVETIPLRASGLLGSDYPAYIGVRTERGGNSPFGSFDRHLGPTDASGCSQSPDAMFSLLEWRRVGNDGSFVWAHRKEILEAVTPVAMEQADRPSQIRFRLGDLADAKIGPALQAICYMHARRISATNAQFLSELTQQLGVRPADAARTAEQLLGARLVCPLGGEYQLDAQSRGVPRWRSTGWPRDSVYDETAVPQSYRFPFLDWLRGAEIHFNLTPTVLSVHAELDVKPGARSEPVSPKRRPRAAAVSGPYQVEKPEIVQTRASEPEPYRIADRQPLTRPFGDLAAFVDVEVPEDAAVFVNGAPTRSTGVFRRYVSSGLAPGLQYPFEFRTLMIRESQRVEQTQQVNLRAGETAHLVFTRHQATPVDTAFRIGDAVLVSTDRAPLAIGDAVLARIPQGRRLPVLQIQDGWLWTLTEENGRRLEGWVPMENVILSSRTSARR